MNTAAVNGKKLVWVGGMVLVVVAACARLFAVFYLRDSSAAPAAAEAAPVATTPAFTNPTAADMAAAFPTPPSDDGIALWWGWGGPFDTADVGKDLDSIRKMGFTVACVEADARLNHPYLSPQWFDLVKTAVQEAKKRDMRLWFEDEGKYPSGFAGGLFTKERPDLCMQVLAPAAPIIVAGGKSISQDLPPNAVTAVAVNQAGGQEIPIDITTGKLAWTAPPGQWTIRLIEHEFRTSPTRSVNNPTGAKDSSESIEDYLNPAATRQFIAWTHDQYKAAVGDELGKTVIGFTGDEPDYTIGNAIPWTNELFRVFDREKGYDVRPYLSAFFSRQMTDRQRRAYADYWDVWSGMFSDNFFGVLGDWCAANNCEYQLHINHEDELMQLVRSEGDFLRDMRPVEMPGIDLIWHQIFTDNVQDFPKLASSAANVFGRPRSYTESFAAMRPPPNVMEAMWILNEEMVRGVNMIEIMWWASPAERQGRGGRAFAGATTRPTARGRGAGAGAATRPIGPSFFLSPDFPPVAAYLHRATYLLSQGKPTAKIALYVPFDSMWLSDADSYASMLSLSAQLLQHQRDFDFVNEQAFSSVLKLDGGKFINLSGETYQAVVIPSVTVLSKTMLDRLSQFASAGGKVIFLGRLPTMIADKTFLDAAPPPDLSWGIHEPSGNLTDAVLSALPAPDVKFDQPRPTIKYTHRRAADSDIYFFFNESAQPQSATATLAGTGSAQIWDGSTGAIQPPVATAANGSVTLPLALAGGESRFIIVGPEVKQ
jgi:hypothetical protein